MYIEDLVPLQETILRTQENRFWVGLQRIQQCLYGLMACFTVNRLNAMRNLQYRHLLLSLQWDPHGGPPRILIEITYRLANKYLGVTQGYGWTWILLISNHHSFPRRLTLHSAAPHPANVDSGIRFQFPRLFSIRL
jgi:Protein of unknown function (DUF3435)